MKDEDLKALEDFYFKLEKNRQDMEKRFSTYIEPGITQKYLEKKIHELRQKTKSISHEQ